MGFYEDDRIRRKNSVPAEKQSEQKPNARLALELDEKCSLSRVLEVLRDAKFKVSLRGKNTIVIE